MNMVIPDEGKELWLYWALCSDGSDVEDFVVDLFKNDYTPDDDSTASDFTPANFTGYSQIDIERADFSAPAIVSHVAESTGTPAPQWQCTGGSLQTCYGWYMRSASTGIVLAAQRFDVPRDMTAGAVQSLDPFKFKLKTFA